MLCLILSCIMTINMLFYFINGLISFIYLGCFMKKIQSLFLLLLLITGVLASDENKKNEISISIQNCKASFYSKMNKACRCNDISQCALTVSLYYLFSDFYNTGSISIKELPSKSLLVALLGYISTEYYLEKMRQVKSDYLEQGVEFEKTFFDHFPGEAIFPIDMVISFRRMAQTITLPIFALLGLGAQLSFNTTVQYFSTK